MSHLNLMMKPALRLIITVLCLQLSNYSAATEPVLRFRFLESLDYSEGKITFDPYIREFGSPLKFEVWYRFCLEGDVRKGDLEGLNYTFVRADNELLEIICKIKELKDGEVLESKNLVNIKRIGPNIVGLIYRNRDGVFTPFEFNLAYESAAKFSDNVNTQAIWLRKTFKIKDEVEP